MDCIGLRIGYALGMALCTGVLPCWAQLDGACDKTTDAAGSACQSQASADYWIAVGKCENLLTSAERIACKAEARQARAEALALCAAQNAARDALCEDVGSGPYAPQIDPAQFVVGVDHPYFPLIPGTTLVYEADDGSERVEVTTTHNTRVILGVTCVEVHDVVSRNGELIEDTLDWYAQDLDGNVWYMGENTAEYEDGLIVSIDGSWIAGVDGASAGIIMLGAPQAGSVYRQEFLLGEAEDAAEVLSLSTTVTVPYGVFTDCVQTAEFSSIEPSFLEDKYNAPGIGHVLTVDQRTGKRVELVDIMME